jgi:hypothetical protein
VIFLHPLAHEHRPPLGTPVDSQGQTHRSKQRLGRRVPKFESIGASGSRSVRPNRIAEAANRPHDRDGSVPKAVHLIEPARLKSRRHQKEIGARLDEVRQPVIESNPHTDA